MKFTDLRTSPVKFNAGSITGDAQKTCLSPLIRDFKISKNNWRKTMDELIYKEEDLDTLKKSAEYHNALADRLMEISQSFPNGSPARVDVVEAAGVVRGVAQNLELKHQFLAGFGKAVSA
jgi:hypothetical protein